MAKEGAVSEEIKAVIQLTAQETADTLLERHRVDCPINSLVKDFWGIPGDVAGGVKNAILSLQLEIKSLAKKLDDLQNQRKSFVQYALTVLRPLLTAGISALILAVIWYATKGGHHFPATP